MRLMVRERSAGEIEFGILYGAIAVLALAAARILPVLDLLPSCLFRGVTGIPCPTCGVSRALVLLAHGDLRQGLAMNPVFAVTLAASLVLLVCNCVVLFNSCRFSLSLTHREALFVRGGSAFALLANWAYLILHV